LKQINLHLLNAAHPFTPSLASRIEGTFKDGLASISALLPISGIDVVVRGGSRVVEETGMAGYSPSEKEVQITIDPQNRNLMKNFDTEFISTLGHEMHHCLRWKDPGFGETLAEFLISEGLACHFETELRNGAPPCYATALDEQRIAEMWQHTKTALNDSNADYRAWFLGSEEKSIPRFTGYSLGFKIVSQYIRKHGLPASRLWNKKAEAFYEDDWGLKESLNIP
jgi:uncharacterized protein YjaZ